MGSVPAAASALTILAIVLAALSFLGPAASLAQSPPPTPFVGTSVAILASLFEATPEGSFGGFVEPLLDGQVCGRWYFGNHRQRDAAGNYQVNLEIQRAPCSAAGTKLTFVTAEGRVLEQSFTNVVGEQQLLTSFEYEASTTGGATFVTVSRAGFGFASDDAANEYAKANNPEIEIRTGNVVCGRINLWNPAFTDVNGDPALQLDAAGVSSACAKAGATLYAVGPRGFRILRRPVVVPGERLMLVDVGTEPPHYPPPPGMTQAPGAPDAGTGQWREQPRPRVWAAVAIAVLLASPGVWAVVRRVR